MFSRICILLFCFFATACSLKPSLEKPNVNFSTRSGCEDERNSKFNVACRNAKTFHFDKEWWRSFNDDELNSLIQKAFRNNTDLKIAFVRFEQAAETLGIDRSDLFPKLDGSASATRSKMSKNSAGNTSGRAVIGNNFNMGLNLSYELDLWGKYRDKWGAASSAYEASAYDFETAKLSLASNVAKLYFNSINLASQVQILEESLMAYEETYNIKLELFNVGAISEYELLNYKTQLDSAKASLAKTKTLKDANEKSLIILVSNDFDSILYQNLENKEIKNFDIEIPSGISSEILFQRPDIQASLKRLEQSNYLVGVARSAFLPSISLTGALGYGSSSLDNLIKNSSGTWSGGANALLPIFHWGEINSNINLAKLAKDEMYLNYENILKVALGEVRTALLVRQTAFENEKNYKNLLQAQQKIYELAQIRYENGSINLNELLDAQRNYLNSRISYENSVYELLASVVDVAKAFGGGFNVKEDYEDNLENSAQNLDMSFRE